MVAGWLTHLSEFNAGLCRYLPLNLAGILQFTFNQLKKLHITDLLLLTKMLERMSGRESISDMTLSQLTSMSGGDILKMDVLVKNVGVFSPSYVSIF